MGIGYAGMCEMAHSRRGGLARSSRMRSTHYAGRWVGVPAGRHRATQYDRWRMQSWLLTPRQRVAPGSATIKAIDYSLRRWAEWTLFVDDGDVPISNNWVENQIRPIALRRANRLFAGSPRVGKRAAAVMSLLQSARINGVDPVAYFKDVLELLPTHPASRIDELLPHHWKPTA